MIQSIGFKNFRRFENFPDMELGKINIFVGRNNAGKSTVMKAIELFKGNLRHLSYISNGQKRNMDMRPAFSFDTEETSEINIDNFERALYNRAKRKEITLTAGYNDFKVELVLDGVNMKRNDTFVSVPYSSVHFWNDDMDVSFDYDKRILDAKFFKISESDDIEIEELNWRVNRYGRDIERFSRYISELDLRIAKLDTTKLEDVAELNDLKRQKLRYERNLAIAQERCLEYQERIDKFFFSNKEDVRIYIEDIPTSVIRSRANVFQQIFESMFDFAELYNRSLFDDTKKEKMIELILQYRSAIRRCARIVQQNLTLFSTEYIPAHAASQKVIFLKDDKNDFLSATLNEFCKLHIRKTDDEWKFISKWMSNKEDYFGLGDDFKIDDTEGAGYYVKIKTDGLWENLADKGVGTIQLMILLLKLAIIMRNARNGLTILIEEPEQNVHPMLQSKIADMLLDFHEIMKKKGCDIQLIVETHSEYIIRKIQLLVAKMPDEEKEDLDKNNPFSVFYFDTEYKGESDNSSDEEKEIKPYYKMIFRTNGRFSNRFGNGFLDEATNLAFELF